MKKELRYYDTIIGLTDFDEWSYCEKDQMWYEDAKEVLPHPEKEPEVVTDLICEIKVNHDASIWDEADDWDKLKEEKDGLEKFAQFLFGENKGWDCTDNALLLKTANQGFITGLNDYGLWELESFIKKLKNQLYATEYSEYGGALKFIAWTNDINQTRFVIHSYNAEYRYLETIFDITIDRDILIYKLENVLKIWHDTVYNVIKAQERMLGKKATNPHCEPSVDHFFPELKTPVEIENKDTPQIKNKQETAQEEKNTENKPKEYTAFGVTGGIGTMIGVFFVLLVCKYGYVLFFYLPDFIERVKRFFGG